MKKLLAAAGTLFCLGASAQAQSFYQGTLTVITTAPGCPELFTKGDTFRLIYLPRVGGSSPERLAIMGTDVAMSLIEFGDGVFNGPGQALGVLVNGLEGLPGLVFEYNLVRTPAIVSATTPKIVFTGDITNFDGDSTCRAQVRASVVRVNREFSAI